MRQTSVAFFIFNRPELAARVLAQIALARPSRLLVIADGPRSDAERGKCTEARRLIREIDWSCEVLTNFSDVNLGCKRRIASGLNWVFEQCEDAIILEDDCLPHPTFFRYCAELLDRYQDDERVMMVSGDNFQLGRRRTEYSYYFSRYSHVWGWASWRRAWRHYDGEIILWRTLRRTAWLRDILGHSESERYWREVFDRVCAGAIDTWDYQWLFTVWAQNGLTILPSVNLVSNVGFGGDATHTKGAESQVANLPACEMIFPLQHPPHVLRDEKADQWTFDRMFAWERRRTRWLRYPSSLRAVLSVVAERVHSSIAGGLRRLFSS